MVTKEHIEQLINPRINRVLLYVEAALSASQFKACRKLILDEFGNSGLGKDLERMLGSQERHGNGRNIRS